MMQKTTKLTTANSLDDINSNIEYFKAKIITLKKELVLLTDEIFEKQHECQEKYNDILLKEAYENENYEMDLKIKNDELEKSSENITKLDEEIQKNEYANVQLECKISEYKDNIEKIAIKINDWTSTMKTFKEKEQEIDKKNLQEIKESVSNFQGSIESKKKQFELAADLYEIDPIDANIQKNWGELWTYHQHLLSKEKEEKGKLESKNSDFKEQILKNQKNIKNKIKEKMKKNEKLTQLEIEIKELNKKIKNHKQETKNKLDNINKAKSEHINQSKSHINQKSNDIIKLFHDFKAFNETLKKDFDFFSKIKKDMNTFLNKYFVNTNISAAMSIMQHYNDDIKDIIEIFIATYGKGRYNKILESIKNFTNYKKTNNEQETQPSTSTSSSIKEIKNNSKLELFDFEKLELKLWSIINVISNYQHFLQEHKNLSSNLIFVSSSNLQEQEKKSENEIKELNKKIEKYVGKSKSKKLKSSFYFLQMLSFEECNEEKQLIFQELKDKKTKNNKNIIFTKDKRFGLLSDAQNGNFQELPLLIDFTELIKIPKKFFPLINDYKKNGNFSKKTLKEISNSFKQKNNHEFIILNLKTQNNYVKDYIKNLDTLYTNINDQKNELEKLSNLFYEFYEYIQINKELMEKKLNNIPISETIKKNNFEYQIGNKIINILETTLKNINIMENFKNILQTVNIVTMTEVLSPLSIVIPSCQLTADTDEINEEPSPISISFSNQTVLFNNKF